MGNWWDVITSPVQQAVSNLGSNIAAARSDAQQLGNNMYQAATSNEVTFTKPSSDTTNVTTPIQAPKPTPSSDTTNVTKPIQAPKPTPSSDFSGDQPKSKYNERTGEFTARWIEPISSRPGFRKAEDLGLDRKTWSLISEGYTPLQAVTMRLQEETNPRIRRELDYQQNQLAQNKIEVSSGYHNWAKATEKPQSINPFEHEGDMALGLKQGTRQESKLQISKSDPGVADIFADLPDGKGLEDVSWDQAKTEFTTKSPDFIKAVNRVESARYDPGVYGMLKDNRDYSAWNLANPEARVTVGSPGKLVYGKSRSRNIPALYGSFGSKTEKQCQTKKYDKSIHETLFGSGNPRKTTYKKPSRGVKGNEWDMLKELGVKRPIAKKPEKSLKDNLQYMKERGSFQSMRKPTTSIRNVVLEEIEELENSGLIHKKQKKGAKKKGVR